MARILFVSLCIRLYRYRYINLINLFGILFRNFHHQELFSLNLDLVYGGIRCHSFEKDESIIPLKNCEVSQIRSVTLNCLSGERVFLQTTTETSLLQSILTTNNS